MEVLQIFDNFSCRFASQHQAYVSIWRFQSLKNLPLIVKVADLEKLATEFVATQL